MKVSDEILIAEYKKLNSAYKVAKKLVISSSTASYRLKKLGVLKKWKKEVDNNKLIDSYIKHQSVRKTAKDFDISHETARYKLKKLGVLNKPIIYNWNDNYFSKDNADVYYWAGFIAADGCVKLNSKKYKQLSIGLSRKDHEHLEKFKKAIEFTGQIYKIAGNYDSSQIAISSGKLFDDLARFNIVPRKSLIYTFPKWLIDHPLVNHFMRGYNDGDGSFYISKKKDRNIDQLYFSLRGTKEFLCIFNEILEDKCKFKKHKEPRLNSGIYCLEFGGNIKVRKIRDFLYKNSAPEIRLERKYNISFGDTHNI